jgi:hypothetical protein
MPKKTPSTTMSTKPVLVFRNPQTPPRPEYLSPLIEKFTRLEAIRGTAPVAFARWFEKFLEYEIDVVEASRKARRQKKSTRKFGTVLTVDLEDHPQGA